MRQFYKMIKLEKKSLAPAERTPCPGIFIADTQAAALLETDLLRPGANTLSVSSLCRVSSPDRIYRAQRTLLIRDYKASFTAAKRFVVAFLI